MSTRIEDCRGEVERIFASALAAVERREPQRMFEVEREIWVLLLAAGRALMTILLAQQASLPRAAQYQHGGKEYALAEEAEDQIGTRFGKVPFRRRVGRLVKGPRAARDYVVDRALGLCGGFSLGVVCAIARLSAQMAFGQARSTFAETWAWAPSTRSVLRMVDAAGAQARPFLEQSPAPDDDGEVLVIEVDAGGAPHITPEELAKRQRKRKVRKETQRAARRRRKKASAKPRRTKGKKSKNAKMSVVGAIYTFKCTERGLEGPVNKRIYATFESHDALFDWLQREAKKRGYGNKRTIFLGDGSEHIWNLQEVYFEKAEPCVDWWHIVEKLWLAAGCLHKEGSDDLASFAQNNIRRLRAGNAAEVCRGLRVALAKIPRTGPGNAGRRKRLEEVVVHLESNQHRMPYAKFRREGLCIGSGVIEGAVRNLVRCRLDGPGMRWSRRRSEMVLHLRCVLINNQWDAFVTHLANLEQLVLEAQPTPTQPHLAKAAA